MFRMLLAALALCFTATPAAAGVTITFWSHEFGSSFPHAFFTLRGAPDAGGLPVEANIGFTAKAVTPALLMGSVPGKLDIVKPTYVEGSDAQFSVVLTDAQYARILALIAGWDDRLGDGRYNLGKRNCIHFVKEAARIAGLSMLDHPKLMKRPRSYLLAVREANAGRITVIGLDGDKWKAALPAVAATAPVPLVLVMSPPPLPRGSGGMATFIKS
ncbi:hypothetical protein GGQ80_003298 [Sphingomonas jinjuensis]|uniref:DUF4105 domain-containing protein n=1 Tax=Sphingomonas jinjuensis TaxID=535907 RepID=A0A840FN85_9SPHN|nr:hypothetical protein [Sphingomonas jinjuensis]MBB4155378.1 hypothetical protein [Sphingomonas jinjuensis]